MVSTTIREHQKECRVCGETDQSKFFASDLKSKKSRPACRRCNRNETTVRYRKYKQIAIAYKGGKCQVCGYSKCSAALEFHHRDRRSKDKNWPRMRLLKLTQLKDELDKCDIVCRNCHAEIHFNTPEM